MCMSINCVMNCRTEQKTPGRKFRLSNGISDMYRRHNNQSIWTSDEHRLAVEGVELLLLHEATKYEHTCAPVCACENVELKI